VKKGGDSSVADAQTLSWAKRRNSFRL